ncbi:MAG: DUF1800 domain-containing protein [Saprospiraceae bacterium]|nr:DUF1800 domain-containing protein [Saprospiraceae bacterium]
MASLQPFTGVMGNRLAAHLLRRTSYRPTRERILYYASLTPQEAINELFNFAPLTRDEPIDPNTGQPWMDIPNDEIETADFWLTRFILSWWSDEAVKDNSAGHKIEFFLHTLIPVNAAQYNKFVFDHIRLLRFYALDGDFKALALKTITDQNMLFYLDNQLNSKFSVNENYAREYLELHTILKGPEDGPGSYTNYTEEDVSTAARLLTGFRVNWDRIVIDPDTGIPRGDTDLYTHDTDDKTFSDKFQNRTIVGRTTEEEMYDELADFVDMIFDQRATAENLCRRAYRFFVSPNITTEIENDIIQPLTDQIYNDTNSPDYYNLNAVLKTLLQSQHFFDKDDNNDSDEIVGALVKSPYEIFLNIMAIFDIIPPEPVDAASQEIHYLDFYTPHLNNSLQTAGMEFYYPETVAGYPAYHQEPNLSRNWFVTANIIGRFRVPEMLLKGKYLGSGGYLYGNSNVPFNIAEFARDYDFFTDPSDAILLVDEFLQFLLPELTDDARKAYFQQVFLDDLSPINWMFEWQNYIETDDDSAVRIALENLYIAVLYSEEFQLK